MVSFSSETWFIVPSAIRMLGWMDTLPTGTVMPHDFLPLWVILLFLACTYGLLTLCVLLF